MSKSSILLKRVSSGRGYCDWCCSASVLAKIATEIVFFILDSFHNFIWWLPYNDGSHVGTGLILEYNALSLQALLPVC